MRTTMCTAAGLGVLGLVLGPVLAVVGTAADAQDVSLGSAPEGRRGDRVFRVDMHNGRKVLTQGMEKLTTRRAADQAATSDAEARQRAERAIEQRRAMRKDTAARLQAEFERLTRDGHHGAAAIGQQELLVNALQSQVENFDAFIQEHFQEQELLRERIETLEKRIKELEAKRD